MTTLLNNIVPNFEFLPEIAKRDLVEAWTRDGADIRNPPVVDLEANTWSYKNITDIVDFRIIHTMTDIKTIIYSYLIDFPNFKYNHQVYFQMYFGTYEISRWSLRYGDKFVLHFLPEYNDALRKMRAKELTRRCKKPIAEIKFVQQGDNYRFWTSSYRIRSEDLEAPITSYLTGNYEESEYRLVPKTRHGFDPLKFTLCNDSSSINGRGYSTLNMDANLLQNLLLSRTYYLVMKEPVLIMWNVYKAKLIEYGLPRDYADRISIQQIALLMNFGQILRPKYCTFKYRWELVVTHPRVCIPIELEAVSGPARKRRCCCGGCRPLTLHERALREISPSYYMSRYAMNPILVKGGVRMPKYVTKKDVPISDEQSWEDKPELWTGRVQFYRTWKYETTTGFIPEGKMNLKRYSESSRCIGKLTMNIKAPREFTSMIKILTGNY